MPVNENYLARFESGNTYHVYNKTNNRELLFRSDENYLYFLKQYTLFIAPLADTYAWNFLPNHFHLLNRIKPLEEIVSYIKALPALKQTKSEKAFLINKDVNILIQMAYKRFFTSYAMAYNNMYERTGNLFYRTFKRVEITKDIQFTQALIYIHANAKKHKLVKDFTLHRWTSYHSIVSGKPTKLLRNEILEWFGGVEQFIKTHQSLVEYYYSFPGSIEDDSD